MCEHVRPTESKQTYPDNVGWKLNYSCMYWTPQLGQNWPVHSDHSPEFQAWALTRIYNRTNAFQKERKSGRKQDSGNVTVSATCYQSAATLCDVSLACEVIGQDCIPEQAG